ncbi:MAG: endolytic transglycosylase MltG, partial [Rickettsiales bacterium]|nr:endolytic transglycosylase MltG [Rickettsiales bacterium]
ICNPGKASIDAVMNPQKSNYYYFVADGEGGHWFSRTLEEHNQNVARYRKKLAEQSAQTSSTTTGN